MQTTERIITRFENLVPDLTDHVDPQTGTHVYYDALGLPCHWTPSPPEVLGQLALETHTAEALLEAEVIPLLRSELNQSQAPLSGREVACVLVTGDANFSGHVTEDPDNNNIQYATTDALRKLRQHYPRHAPRIESVYMAGRNIAKPKHAMPTPDAYDELRPWLADDADLVVMQLDNSGEEIARAECKSHQTAYAYRPASELRGRHLEVIMRELESKTPLDPKDRYFIARLRLLGLDTATQYYLTGSGSGRGAASSALSDQYHDLDLIAVSAERPAKELEASFEALLRNHYGPVQKDPHLVRAWPSGAALHGLVYHNAQVSIDFFTGRSLPESMVRQSYHERNFFHKIS